jgi:tetratricopeptide (TPR) repeat protein
MSHLTGNDVDRFLAGEPAACRRAVRHLLAGCLQCQAKLWGPVGLEISLTEDSNEELFQLAVSDEIVERAIAASLREVPRWEEEKHQLSQLLNEARSCPEGILGLQQAGDQDVSGWPLVEGLLVESQEARFRAPERMRILAFAAMVAAQNLDRRQYSSGQISDLCARAWAELANAYRLNHEFEASEDALTRAKAHLEQGTGDPLILAHLLDLEASLRNSQRRLPEAIELLDHVYRLYLQIGDSHLAGRTLISKGVNTAFDRPKDGVQLVQDGLVLLDFDRDPRLAAIGQCSLIHSLVECGEFRQAGHLLLKSGLREAFAKDPLNLIKLRWLEGRIHAGLGKLWRAEQVLREVRDRLQKHGQDYDAALVGLDLAQLWLRQGNYAGVRELAKELLQTFSALGIQREGIKAGHYLREASRQEP